MKQSRNKDTVEKKGIPPYITSESIEKWCYDPMQVSIIYSKHLLNPSKDFYDAVESFFYHDENICFECLDRYYEFKNKIVKRQDIDVLKQHDIRRIRKFFAEKKYKRPLIEIFKYNWYVLNEEDIRMEFFDILKACLEKKLSVFNVLTFTHVYLLLFNDELITKYIMKSIGAHFSKNSLFVQTESEEWEFLLNFSEYYSNTVYEASKYKNFSIKGWCTAMFIYLAIDGTYYDERIVSILNRLFFDKDFNVQRKMEIFMVICAFVKRKKGMANKFEDVFKNILEYDFFHYIKNNLVGETQITNSMIFWQPIHFYLNFFPEFAKIKLEKEYYDFFSEFTDEYFKKELFKIILKNAYCITNVKSFEISFPFFEEMILNILKIDDVKKTYFYELNPEFTKICVLKAYNFTFKANKYVESDWDSLYIILNKWYNITVVILRENRMKLSYNIKELSGFILLLYFDISYYLQQCGQNKVLAVYKNFKKNLLNLFTNAPRSFYNELDQEKLTYINTIKYFFAEEKSFSQIYNFLDENILTQIIDKQSTFCTKFGYHSIYFTEFLVILSKCKRISMNLYLKIFMMLLTQMMQKEILELLCFLVNKIELHRRDYTNNFILDMDWVQALEDKVIEEETLEIKLILAARHFKFLIDNKLIYNEQTVDKIKRICSKLGISSINEFAAKSPSNLYSSE